MKILWITNIPLPPVASHQGLPINPFGGWMISLLQGLAKAESVSLAVATVYDGEALRKAVIDNVQYFLLPCSKKMPTISDLAVHWQKVVTEFQPDLVHIHGTEYSYGMTLMQTYPDLTYIVSIQGLVSVCYRYFFAGMTIWDVARNITFRDLVRWDTFLNSRHRFHRRGEIEKAYIQKANFVIGRIEWDYACAKAIQLNVRYFHCDEILREPFWTDEIWHYENCQPYSIFLSQGNYPIKGLHIVLKAVALIKRDYPQVRILTAGHDILRLGTPLNRLKRSGYGAYILRLLKQLNLQNYITFLGVLDSERMRKAYLKANVFISASSIENGSNSIGEAQILGVPVIASFVGGVTTTLKDATSAEIYEFSAYEVLAEKLRKVFALKANIATTEDRKLAQARHSRAKNLQKQMEIYQEAMDCL